MNIIFNQARARWLASVVVVLAFGPVASAQGPETPVDPAPLPTDGAPEPETPGRGPAASDAAESPGAAAPTSPEPEPSPTAPAPAAKGAAPVEEAAAEGPSIELPPSAEPHAELEPEAVDPLRGMKQSRLDRTVTTSVGGYGELHYSHLVPEHGDAASQIDLHRFVVFFSHRFTDAMRFYSEVEVEHAVASNDAPGEIEIEQAQLDWDLVGEALSLRAGLVLVPMGIVNQWHEPPIFNGVERPAVDTVIIPSTWREAGLGVFGEPAEWLRYEAYLTLGGLDPAGFSPDSGLRGGRQHAAEAAAGGFALTGRVEVEPLLGFVAGLSGYHARTGPNLDGPNAGLDLDVPVTGVSADARWRWEGLEARAVGAFFAVGDTERLRDDLVNEAGEPALVDVGSRLYGVYGEIGYDVLHFADTEHTLVPFVRIERFDTMASVEGTPVDDVPPATSVASGLTYRPLPPVVFKGDAVLTLPDEGDRLTQLDLGIGWMF